MTQKQTYQTSWGRVIFSILSSSIISAAILLAILFSIVWLGGGDLGRSGDSYLDIAGSTIFPWVVIALSTAIAIVVVAGPPWITLHQMGYRNWYVGVILGGLTTNLVFLFLILLVLPLGPIWVLLPVTVWGGAVGWLVWWQAYDKEPLSP